MSTINSMQTSQMPKPVMPNPPVFEGKPAVIPIPNFAVDGAAPLEFQTQNNPLILAGSTNAQVARVPVVVACLQKHYIFLCLHTASDYL